jgi:hypothetical protein
LAQDERSGVERFPKMEDGENGRQEAKERGQEPALEGIPEWRQPGPENLSMAEWDAGCPSRG